MGAPEAAIAASSERYASGQEVAFLVRPPKAYDTNEEFDYINFALFKTPPAPSSFRGVSGGGLADTSRRKSKSAAVTEGVAFYEEITDEFNKIRCHARHATYRHTSALTRSYPLLLR